jgi:hypothetical protein
MMKTAQKKKKTHIFEILSNAKKNHHHHRHERKVYKTYYSFRQVNHMQ